MTVRRKSISVLLVFALACAPTAYTTLVTIDASHVGAIDAAFVDLGIGTPARGHVTPVRADFTVHAEALPPSQGAMSDVLARWTRSGTSSDAACGHRCAPSRPRSPPRS